MTGADWAAMTRSLVDVAMGRRAASLVIRNGRWVCVQTGEILPGTDVAVFGERTAYVGPDARHAVGAETRGIQADRRPPGPGLLGRHSARGRRAELKAHPLHGGVQLPPGAPSAAGRETPGAGVGPADVAEAMR